MSKKLNGSVDLTKFIHYRMKTKKGTMGTFIPDEQNNLTVKKDKEDAEHAYADVVVWINDKENDRGQIGSIKLSLSSEEYKKIVADKGKDEAIKISKELPYLGNLKDFSGGSNETSNAAAPGTFEENADDLPF